MMTAIDNPAKHRAELLEQLRRTIVTDRQIMATEPARTATQLVWGDGNPAAKVVFIGEAPGASEDKAGRPFVGQAGKLLEDCLREVGLSRTEDVWITNLVKHRPPANRDPSEAEKGLYADYLDQELAVIRPAVIIPLGRHAASHFLSDFSISRQHGQARQVNYEFADGSSEELFIMPFYHPAAALYNPHLLTVIKEDFSKLQSIL